MNKFFAYINFLLLISQVKISQNRVLFQLKHCNHIVDHLWWRWVNGFEDLHRKNFSVKLPCLLLLQIMKYLSFRYPTFLAIVIVNQKSILVTTENFTREWHVMFIFRHCWFYPYPILTLKSDISSINPLSTNFFDYFFSLFLALSQIKVITANMIFFCDFFLSIVIAKEKN